MLNKMFKMKNTGERRFATAFVQKDAECSWCRTISWWSVDRFCTI